MKILKALPLDSFRPECLPRANKRKITENEFKGLEFIKNSFWGRVLISSQILSSMQIF